MAVERKWKKTKRGKPKPSDVVRQHHHQLCKALDVSDNTLQYFTGHLFQEEIIDAPTKIEVLRKKGCHGADILLNLVRLKVDLKPKYLETVLMAMRPLTALQDIAEKMEQELHNGHGEEEDCEDISSDTSLPLELDKGNAVTAAENLKKEFLKLLLIAHRCVSGVDVTEIRLCISWFINSEKLNTSDILAHIDYLEKLSTSSSILNYLVSRGFVGYLNYQLLKEVQTMIRSEQLEKHIQFYETKHDDFLLCVSFNTMIEIFEEHPNLAPNTHVGLPKFQIHLQDEWNGKRVYEWVRFFEMRISWPQNLIVTKISRMCVVLTYAVLPLFVSSVVTDLINPEVLKELENAGARVEIPNDLLEMELHSFAFNIVSAPEIGSIGKLGVDAYIPTAVDEQCSGNIKRKQSYNGEDDFSSITTEDVFEDTKLQRSSIVQERTDGTVVGNNNHMKSKTPLIEEILPLMTDNEAKEGESKAMAVSGSLDLDVNQKQLRLLLHAVSSSQDQESLDVHTVSKTKPRGKQPIQKSSFTKDEELSNTDPILQVLSSFSVPEIFQYISHHNLHVTEEQQLKLVSLASTSDLFTIPPDSEMMRHFSSTMDDTMRKSILIYSVKERDDLVKKADSLEFDIDTLKEELKLSEERTEVYKKMSIAKTKELEIKSKEAKDLMSVTKPPHSVLQDEESIRQLEKKHNFDLPMDDEEKFNVDEDVNQTESTLVTGNRYYTGQLYYFHQDLTNKWKFTFRIYKLASMRKKDWEYKNVAGLKDQMIVFEFVDPLNGYIELDLTTQQERSSKGWTLIPHMLPLRIHKRDVDFFESGELSDPPCCLITVYGKTAQDTEGVLSYRIGLIGVKSDTKMLYINAVLDTSHITDEENITHLVKKRSVDRRKMNIMNIDDEDMNQSQNESTDVTEEEDDESLHSKEDIETKDEREEETIGLIRKHEDGAYSQHDKENIYSPQMCSCCRIRDLRKGKRCTNAHKEDYPRLLVLNPSHEVSTHFKHTLEVKIRLSAQTEKLSRKYQECSARTWSALRNQETKRLVEIGDVHIQLRIFGINSSLYHNIKHLHQYYDIGISPGWWKVEPIHYLAKTLLSDLCPEVISEWNNYFDIFKAYCSDRNRKEYAHMLFNTNSDIFFFMEIDECYDHFTLQMISELRKTISYILDLPELSLHLICLETE